MFTNGAVRHLCKSIIGRNLDVKIHTYFESTADQELQLDEALMENEVWNLLRINPESDLLDVEKMIPSLEYLRLRHREAKAYPVDIAQKSVKDTITTTFDYTSLNRTLKIKQKAEFPYEILGLGRKHNRKRRNQNNIS